MLLKEETFNGFGGAELFYRIFKPNTNPKAAILVVHGLGDHSGGLHNLLQPLAENGYIAYALDLRGHGKSSGTRGYIRTWDEYRGDLHEFRKLVSSEHPGLPLFMVIHSLGGVIGLDYALYYGAGIAGITAIAPAISYEVSLFEKLFISLVGFLKPDFTLKTTSKPHLLTQVPEVLARIQSDNLRHNMVTPGLGRELMKTVPKIMNGAHYLNIPFLLMYGLDDEITPPEKLRQFFTSLGSTDKQKFEYKNTKHRPFEDLSGEQFISDLLNWLDRQVEVSISINQ